MLPKRQGKSRLSHQDVMLGQHVIDAWSLWSSRDPLIQFQAKFKLFKK